ncbi:MAG TPA: hypothetical protein DEO89_07040 [Lachnospiraceae bacterium]|nr:hypothetical protein [Lachnospiraceae bacterium]
MKNGCMKKGIRLWLLGMIFVICLVPGIPGRAEELEEISYKENHAFQNGTIIEIENQWAVSYLKNHTETSFEVNCDKNEIKEYLEALCDGYFTCKVVEDGITYTEVPLFVEFDLSDFDTRSTEVQEVQLRFTALEGLTFSEECESSFTMKFELRSAYEESVEIDRFPEEMIYKRNWLLPVQSQDESAAAAAKLQQQIKDVFEAAYGLSGEVDLYDGICLEVEDIDLSVVDLTKAGVYPVKVKLQINEEEQETFFLSEENQTVEIQVYVTEDPCAVYKIGEMISGYTAFSWIGERDKEIKVYYMESARELTENELEKTEFREYPADKYWLDDLEEFPLLYLKNENLQQDKYYYMYVTAGEDKLQYFRLKKENDAVDFKTYEGNRDGGDVEEEKPRLEGQMPENAEQVKAEGKETQDTVKISPATGEYTVTDHGVTVSVPSENLNLSEKDVKVNLHVRRTKTGKVSIQAAKMDGTVIKNLQGTKVRVPYPDMGEAAVLNVKNKRGDTVAKAEYRQDQGVAEFEVNEPGTYEIQTAEQSGPALSQGRKMYHWTFYTALAAVVAVIMGGTIVGVWRYRKRR